MTWWRPIADGLWTYEKVEDGVSMLRAVAVRLRDGELAVVSPIADTPAEALDALEALGPVRFLLAPNHFHHAGLAGHQARFPGAVAVASPTAAPRLARQTPCAIAPLDALRGRLPEAVTLLELPGSRAGETWVRLASERGVIWVVGDAFFNAPRVPRTALGAVMWLIRAAPGLRIGPTFLYVALRDRAVYGAWLAEQLADPPAVLVPAHGDVCAGDDLAGRLRDLARARLGV